MRPLRLLLVLVTLVGLTGCGMHIPSDPDDTLNRAKNGELVVGISHRPPWTDISKPDEPSGTEVELVGAFASSIDADVAWHAGSEEELMTMLKDDQLDMIIGGITDKSPWTSHAALTTSYTESAGPDGKKEKHVMAVRMGENAFMAELEKFLLAQGLQP
ncbi:transporter substrate-binding domain-containing protein [Brevibacterium aurantiacum]|uniref:Amino acid ABC transporter substrate-binding protein n=1 Tax=Brevibacterium aurantiacum TaxID=273384 RepID=A0A556C3S3_BREAU|nr:transporter substrate-binding domain-containing protein [Brevibacterium aurantiacum]TSI12062.1 amino acid ABC transporter substrate-binding protein [Brevibacterium aurantiacum]